MKPRLLLVCLSLLSATVGFAVEPAPLPKAKVPPVDRTLHQIAINQIGYATGYAKRFTAPLTADGTPFIVRLAEGSTEPLYRGEIRGASND